MAGLAHPQGERLLSAGAGDCDTIYMVRLWGPDSTCVALALACRASVASIRDQQR